jgi:aryl-alcohol dehydrogenase-like predicted oxidoreductase
MELRHLGNSDLRVSAIGLGCNNFGRNVDRDAARTVIHKALDLGVTLLDTGDTYGHHGGSETIIGEILGARRKDVVLVTKFGRPMDAEGKLQGGSRRYIMFAVEASLKRLKTDWIDLYQSHKPDPHTPIEETLRALDDLVKQGKVRAIGTSHMPAAEVLDAVKAVRAHGLTALASCEDEYSLLARGIERDLLPAMQTNGISLLPYYPLASGLLTGKYKRGAPLPEGSRFAVVKERNYVGQFLTEDNWEKLDALTAFAQRRGLTILDVAMAWIAARPQVASVIAGATRPEQVEANVKAAATNLTAADMTELDRITVSKTPLTITSSPSPAAMSRSRDCRRNR